MRHRKSGRKLNRTSSHRKAMLGNMATSLFLHERIQTTTPKAKELRPFAEKLITLAKKGDLAARRQAARTVKDEEVLRKLFGELGPRFAEREGGYTRILHIGTRPGDNAPIALIELVDAPEAEAVSLEAPEMDDADVDADDETEEEDD